MRRSRRIDAIGVAVPARNEECRITDSIASILVAADAVGPRVTVAVSVAADGCTDSTSVTMENSDTGAKSFSASNGIFLNKLGLAQNVMFATPKVCPSGWAFAARV